MNIPEVYLILLALVTGVTNTIWKHKLTAMVPSSRSWYFAVFDGVLQSQISGLLGLIPLALFEGMFAGAAFLKASKKNQTISAMIMIIAAPIVSYVNHDVVNSISVVEVFAIWFFSAAVSCLLQDNRFEGFLLLAIGNILLVWVLYHSSGIASKIFMAFQIVSIAYCIRGMFNSYTQVIEVLVQKKIIQL